MCRIEKFYSAFDNLFIPLRRVNTEQWNEERKRKKKDQEKATIVVVLRIGAETMDFKKMWQVESISFVSVSSHNQMWQRNSKCKCGKKKL